MESFEDQQLTPECWGKMTFAVISKIRHKLGFKNWRMVTLILARESLVKRKTKQNRRTKCGGEK